LNDVNDAGYKASFSGSCLCSVKPNRRSGKQIHSPTGSRYNQPGEEKNCEKEWPDKLLQISEKKSARSLDCQAREIEPLSAQQQVATHSMRKSCLAYATSQIDIKEEKEIINWDPLYLYYFYCQYTNKKC
jgi:hypothetical protein